VIMVIVMIMVMGMNSSGTFGGQKRDVVNVPDVGE